MDLNFRGTKLSRIENVRVFRVFIFADGVPQYYIEYIDYISELWLICEAHIMCFAYKPYEACPGCARSRRSYSKAMTLFTATLLCVPVPRRIILRIRAIPTSSVRSA